MRTGLKNKRILVTGGTSGIGKALALAFAREGCGVLATGRSLSEVKAFGSPRNNLTAEPLDLTDPAGVERLVRRLRRLDILVNCAGVIARDGREHQAEGFEAVIAVNLTGTMRMCAACQPLLFRSQGCVLNVASMLSFFGSGTVPAYSASKGGIAQLTKSLAIAWAGEGVRVNAIAPGWIATPMTRALSKDKLRSQAILARTPMKRWGQPEDVTGAAVFLCSAQASFITGVILPVDGGYLCV